MIIITITLSRKSVLLLLSVLFLSACAGPSTTVLAQVESQWDFDHQLQFKKTQFDDNNYQLEVISNNKGNFERLSAFLLRRSYLICGTYGYKLELITGVESFDYSRASPNLIMPNLTAKLECPLSN
ncbi:hypothetical protein [Colwellia sp. TT2012]|uniref:hypothetical protein n=1 Tax=Colwellia sp. TT2012 TaxID=1720342 RepID=UPI00070BEB2B|nr:hypothetical protein [Colwellia sp. TT2012]